MSPPRAAHSRWLIDARVRGYPAPIPAELSTPRTGEQRGIDNQDVIIGVLSSEDEIFWPKEDCTVKVRAPIRKEWTPDCQDEASEAANLPNL